MKKRENKDIVKILSIIILISGLLVMFGWILDIEFLKSIVPSAVAMKFATAFSFVFTGISLYFINEHEKRHRYETCAFLPILAAILLLIIISLLLPNVTEINSYIQNIFSIDDKNAAYTSHPGRPSYVTMIDFILIALVNMLTVFHYANIKKKFYILGIIIMITAVIALIGHILNIPSLYYALNGIATGMAINTAVLFLVYGTALIKLSRSQKII